MIKSTPTAQPPDSKKLVAGYSMGQIFSDEQGIFNLSTSLETLYRYKFNPVTNEVEEIAVFKRVRHGHPEADPLKGLRPKRKRGFSTPFHGVNYDVYALFTPASRFKGYMLYARSVYGTSNGNSSEKIYYFFEKSEKKGG